MAIDPRTKKEARLAPPFNIVVFANLKILDHSSAPTQIGLLWQKQPIIFVFLRHFGCLACRAHATQVWRDRDKYQGGGARIVFIGNGSPDFINKFKEDLKILDAPVYTDPTLMSFRAAGFKRGFLASLGPTALANGIKLMAAGATQGSTQGDLWQLGGIVVIKKSGEIAYHYISEVLGDFPPQSDVPSENT